MRIVTPGNPSGVPHQRICDLISAIGNGALHSGHRCNASRLYVPPHGHGGTWTRESRRSYGGSNVNVSGQFVQRYSTRPDIPSEYVHISNKPPQVGHFRRCLMTWDRQTVHLNVDDDWTTRAIRQQYFMTLTNTINFIAYYATFTRAEASFLPSTSA